MGLPNGVHHLAIATRDMKGQIDFFTRVVGMELVALYWMHGGPSSRSGACRTPARRPDRSRRAPCSTWP
jgi:catechol 2,3-dioxygenase-like lactoylglutathione lyase family enzyme